MILPQRVLHSVPGAKDTRGIGRLSASWKWGRPARDGLLGASLRSVRGESGGAGIVWQEIINGRAGIGRLSVPKGRRWRSRPFSAVFRHPYSPVCRGLYIILTLALPGLPVAYFRVGGSAFGLLGQSRSVCYNLGVFVNEPEGFP